MRALLLVPALGLGACAPEQDTTGNAAVVAAGSKTDMIAPAPSPTSEGKTAPSATPDRARSTPNAELVHSMPGAIRGVWRESDNGRVTAAECDLQNYENAVRTLTVREDGFSIFETVGRLLSVAERDEGRIRATFDTTYADEPTRGEYVFGLEDGGESLIVRELGAGAGAALRYRRCPA